MADIISLRDYILNRLYGRYYIILQIHHIAYISYSLYIIREIYYMIDTSYKIEINVLFPEVIS